MKTQNRFFALVLTVCMVLNMVPFGVLAEETNASETVEVVEETAESTAVPSKIGDVMAETETTVPSDVPEESTVHAGNQSVDTAVKPEAPAGGTVTGEPFDTNVSQNYRIPGLVVMDDGTLVASGDTRWDAEKDGGGLDIVVSRSTDKGATWSYTFADYLGDNGNVYNNNSSTLIDPLIVTDGTDLYLFSDLFPAGYSLGTWNTANAFSDTAIGFDSNGNLLLSSDERVTYGYFLNDGMIYTTDGEEAEGGYTVDGWFNLYQDDTYVSNLFFADSPFEVHPTSYICMQTYNGDTQTWSDPELLNLKPEGTVWQVLGPGSGIVTSDGNIAFTAYDGSGICLIYGRGGSWKTVRTSAATNESSIVELSDGTIRAFVKNSNNTVCYVDFTKNGDSYIAGSMQNTGVANTGWCMVSSMKYSKLINGKEAILVCCPTRGGSRYDGKIHVFLLDESNQMELLTSYQVNDTFFAYSDMAELDGGETIALLYEDGCISYDGSSHGPGYSHITYTTVSMETILSAVDAEITAPGSDTPSDESSEPTEGEETPDTSVDNTVTDPDTNITVTAPGLKTVTISELAESTPAEGCDVSVTYSISLTDADGNAYTDSATVKIPVPANMRNAAAYYASVDGTPVPVPDPVDGCFIIEVPHFSDLTISADLKEVDITLRVGQTFVVDDPTGNYTDDKSDPDTGKATMTITGRDAADAKRLEQITSTDDFAAGNSYLLLNQRANELLTDKEQSYDAWSSSNIGLKVAGALDAESDKVWSIYPVDGGYAVKRNDQYLTIAPGNATMEDTAQALTLSYQEDGYWFIYANCTDNDNVNYNFYMSDVGGAAWNGAIAYKETTSDEGHRWLIYEAVDQSAATQITFTGVSAGETTAVVGNVTYHISVIHDTVDVTLYPGHSQSFSIDGYNYSDADAIQPDTNSATMTLESVMDSTSYTVSDVAATALKPGASYLICYDGGEFALTTNEVVSGNWGGTTHLQLTDNNLTATSNNIWTLEAAEGGYIIKSTSGEYLDLATNAGTLEENGDVFSITWSHDASAWIIGPSADGMYLNNLGGYNYGGGWTGDGSKWELYEVTTNTTYGTTKVTFTGVTAGTTTTATVGHVIYNITVMGLADGDIPDLNNIVGSGTVGDVNMDGKILISLDITAGAAFQMDVDLSGYDFIEWSTEDSGIAAVNADGTVTGVAEGETTVTATVTKDGVRESISIPVTVYPSLLDGKDPITVFFYIENIEKTTAYYSMYLESHSTTDALYELEQVTQGQVICFQRPAGVDFGTIWMSGPDENHALAFMSATNSNGDYYPIKNGKGELGNSGSADDESNVTYFYNNGVYSTLKGFSDWDDGMEAMLRTAIDNDHKCDGAHGFSRNSGDGGLLATSLSFISEPLPTVSKTVNGILPTTLKRADFRPYQEGMVASVDELIYYTVKVTIPRPVVWDPDDPTKSAITYTDAILSDVIDNKGNGKAYFYVQELDTNLNGVLDDDEIANADVDGDGTVGDDLTKHYLTSELNAAWASDETSRTLEFYVVYKIQDQDIPGNTIKNTANLTFGYETSYSSGSFAGSAVDNAVITVVGYPIDNIVVDFGLPVTVTGLTALQGFDHITEGRATYGDVTITPQTDADGNALTDADGNKLYAVTYSPTSILQGADVVTLINANENDRVVNSFIVYPASTVFYEEGFAKLEGFEGGSRGAKTQEVQLVTVEGENYGYNSAYIGNYDSSSGDQAASDAKNERATLQFTGTGVDIYANCNESTGILTVMIRNHDTNKLVKFSQIKTQTLAGTSSATNQQGGSNYSLPVFSVTNLPHGTYDVTIQHVGAGTVQSVYLDGYRVYNTLENVTTGVYAASELSPMFVELRNYVLAAYDVAEVTDSSQYKTAAGEILDMVYAADERGSGAFILNVDGDVDIQDLLDNGPKNELYLWPGMSITFKLNSGVTAQIGLKAITGTGATCTINGEAHNVQSSIDMFYDIENGADSGTVVIKNPDDGQGVVSITKLKAFGTSDLNAIFGSTTQANVGYSLFRMVSLDAMDEPVIIRQPADTAAALNEDMAISLKAVGEELAYQWYWRNAGDEEFQKSSCRTDTYYTTMTKARDGREIYCVITDTLGNQITSDTVTLSRMAAEELAIVTQPVTAYAELNEDMAVSLEAVGEGLTYQWYWRNEGDGEFQKSSCRTNTYYTTMNQARDGREIYCVITDALGNQITSGTVKLIRIAAVGLAIVTQPTDSTAALNEDVAISLEAVGEELKYQWYWRNAGEEAFQKSSCRTDTYYTTMTKARDGREIYCVITDALGNQITSDTVTLSRIAAVELAIVTEPVDTTAALNEDMAISLEAVGEGLKYQWYWRNAGEEVFQKSSCRTDTYYTTMTKARNGREIYCVVTDVLGNQVVSEVVTLTMA